MDAPLLKNIMDTHQALTSRRTIHTFQPGTVPDEVIDRALVAANHAPCHRLTFPWRFTIIGPAARKLVAEVAVGIKAASRPLTPEEAERIRRKILNPSHLLVATQCACPDPGQAREDYAACACAIQNLATSLAADGVGSKWSTGQLTQHPENYRITGINPTLEQIIGFIWAGYGETPPPITRPSMEAVVRRTP
jgi:nitroreductase